MIDAQRPDRAADPDATPLASAAMEIEQLQRGMQARTVIGQAQGILMERLGMSAAQAIDYLRRVSSHSNRKLVDIARHIAETRELPTAE
ncbi:ANTAR domain-containing protein [Nocardioides sp. S-58]|uniref:ANTAR domain-containing protein n=1 Tax=Nocardioides renjunii TaxID=3095075 RepID=A0ABU5KB62_9ACTN|nr:ANTAR domain-containing protein [Nocardioides sp. S-58]MDZ5662193.1 ANTAR domain-containing protein [Nocardioides sp. S-58]